ncbi:MAG: hypothetical protein A2V52_01590 [Actinobacteria bacterium RBG_19FT_COMBO_54_7]|uniref:Polysaccharide chain length determinant N-terminal domain-containing protein n=1 Tax=Candidatus Solincola sediminis TaxID=1797199 RepID=A0A1F2WJ17_9ACTN|nr:MAG: hypothetical protein A2Y75_06750 [Candidatus Solincola sediminis]OFW57560.1 MAG: hypothetical protein A2W01_02050 [Candidatus Solincola sediminis]OFW68511.1 MAG: hypothetical protein A2V52_01590 [Actinobacteria bacterium RBG_19FT_COMBO_54_7]
MKPRDLAAAIRKRGWLIIVITILATLIATIAARVQTPSYKVEIEVSAIAPMNPQTKQPDSTIQGVYALSVMASISNAMESIDIARGVHERLLANGIDIPAEDLLAKVKSEADVQTTFAHITVTDSSPTRVAEIANTWGEVIEIKSGNDEASQSSNLKSLLLGGTLIVTNDAIPPKKPTQPKPMVYLGLGIFLGLILGFSTAIGIEYFDPHFRSSEEVEETLGLPVLGRIPKLKASEAVSLLSAGAGITPANEAYSQLRSSIMFSVSERPSKTTLVVAAIPTQEAPYFTANLARSIAFTERKTLLVDCDLRQRAVSKIMEAAGRPGLADALAKKEAVAPSIIETEISYLSFLPAGRLSDNSSDLLSLALLDEYLEELEEAFDEVILYAPALTLAIDGAIIASKVDVSLMVLDSERCSRSIVQSAMESFNMLHLKPTGVVLSNVKMRRRERALRERMVVEGSKERGTATRALGRDRDKPGSHEAKPPEKERRKSGAVKKRQAPAQASITPQVARSPVVIEEPKPEPKAEVPMEKIEARAEPVIAKPESTPPPASSIPPSVSVFKETAADKIREPAPETTREKRFDSHLHRGDLKGHTDITPATAADHKTEEELAQLKEILTEDFRRMGASGASIPKDWLRALNSEDPKSRELARIAIRAYYMAFLRRYDITEESVKRITESIIKMMRKEDEFASMSEKDAQGYLQKMLVDAGARFSNGRTEGSSAPAARAESGTETIAKPGKTEKEWKRKERRFLKQQQPGRKTGEVPKSVSNPEPIETKLWQDKGGEEDWEWD